MLDALRSNSAGKQKSATIPAEKNVKNTQLSSGWPCQGAVREMGGDATLQRRFDLVQRRCSDLRDVVSSLAGVPRPISRR